MRYYSNLAQEMTLTAGVSAADTTLALSKVEGLPASFPFTLVIDPGESGEEVVTCTGLVGKTATVTRGADGTSATLHQAAAKVRHMISSRDLREPQEHIAANAGVHGATGSVVGTTDTQTLTNKTISGSSNTLSNVPKSALPTDTVYAAATQTLTGKSISGATNTLSNIPQSALPATSVSTTGAQSLTNKTLDATNAIAAGAITSGTVSKTRLPSDALYDNYNSGTGTAFVTAASGWSVNAVSTCQVDGRVYSLVIVLTRTGADITTASGNLADITAATVTPSWRPGVLIPGSYICNTTGGGCYLGTDGSVVITDAHSGSTIGNGDLWRAAFTFIK